MTHIRVDVATFDTIIMIAHFLSQCETSEFIVSVSPGHL